MKRWFKQFFCHHNWRDDGHMDFSTLYIGWPERNLLRRYYQRCSKCYKVRTHEMFVVRD